MSLDFVDGCSAGPLRPIRTVSWAGAVQACLEALGAADWNTKDPRLS